MLPVSHMKIRNFEIPAIHFFSAAHDLVGQQTRVSGIKGLGEFQIKSGSFVFFALKPKSAVIVFCDLLANGKLAMGE
jgi:hypothetical protein